MTYNAQKSQFKGSICAVACSCEGRKWEGKSSNKSTTEVLDCIACAFERKEVPYQKTLALENFNILSTSLDTLFNPSEIELMYLHFTERNVETYQPFGENC